MQDLKNLDRPLANEEAKKILLEPPFSQQILYQNKSFTSVCQLIEKRAKASPNSIAVIFEERKLSYLDLHKKSNELSIYLQNQGVKPGVVVGLFLKKNENLIISILGILKAGGTYLPLDIEYPEERLKYMIEDACPSFVLTDIDLTHKLPSSRTFKTCFINMIWKKPSFIDGMRAKEVDIDPESPAYIVYTSGSTNTPKGIVVAHKSLPNVVQCRFQIYPKNPVALLIGSISFDPTLLTILYVLASGGTLCIPVSESYADLNEIIDLINKHSVNFILCVTSFYSMLLKKTKQLPSLRYIFVGGETLPSSLASLHAEVAPKAFLYNEYGPAEHAIGGTIAKIYDPEQKEFFDNTIGKPLPGVQIYILDENLKPVVKSNKGEIFIGGIGLAKGYLNKQELTEQNFFWVTFDDQNPVRLYRTGDWGRFLPDDNIEFFGRIDEQVKIWGHRVELAEIEAVLAKHPLIEEAVVIQEKQNKYLVAIYSTRASHDIKEELHTYLARFLPDYMIPSLFLKIDRWPLNPNGKIDRGGLLSFIEGSANFRFDYQSLTLSQIENELVEIWKKVLQKTNIQKNDNFFDEGGTSMQVSHVQAYIEDKFNLNINIFELFQQPTIFLLAQFLQGKIAQLTGEKAIDVSSKQ